MNVFLPVDTELHRALPALVKGTVTRLVADNRRYRDRLRLRLSAVVGPAGRATLGFSGSAIVECDRLLNSTVLRQAVVDNVEADLAMLVSDLLHSYVIREGYLGLDAGAFHRVFVEVKEFQGYAWLWVAPEGLDGL